MSQQPQASKSNERVMTVADVDNVVDDSGTPESPDREQAMCHYSKMESGRCRPSSLPREYQPHRAKGEKS